MGNYVNKFLAHDHEAHKETVQAESSPTTSQNEAGGNMCTPVTVEKKLFIDPRSVTAGIQRTPIQVNGTPVTSNVRNRMLHIYTKPFLETDLDQVMPPLTPKKSEPKLSGPAVTIQKDCLTPTMNNYATFPRKITPTERQRYKILGLDPRSPAADFSRTPILAPASIVRLRARSQENVNRRGSYESDVCRYTYCETLSQFGVSEVQALPDLAVTAIKALHLVDEQCNDSSTETGSSCMGDSPNSIILSRSRDINVESPNFDKINIQDPLCSNDMSPSIEECNTSRKESLEQVKVLLELDDCQIETVEAEVEEYTPMIEEVKDIKKCCNDTDKIIVWRDSASSLPLPSETESFESNEKEMSDKKNSRTTKEEVIITFDDDVIVKDTLSSKISKVPSENQKKPEIIKRNKNSKGDKILTDDKKVFSDNKTTSDTGKARTPLGNRSNNGKMQVLSAKSPQQLLRNKGITPKMFQENTPPHRSIAKSKLNGMQWDPDSTVLI